MTKSITLVTAMYLSSYYSRMGGRNYSFEHYENPFRNLLSLDANIVVFSHGAEEIGRIEAFFRLHQFTDYEIIEHDLNQCRFSDTIYRLKEQAGLIDANGLVAGADVVYNCRNTHLCLSKTEFLQRAITGSRFQTDTYYWMDAGLFHNGIVPTSVGGMERYLRPQEALFWPQNPRNICTPSLLPRLQQRARSEANGDMIFIGLTLCHQPPRWWHQIPSDSPVQKSVHIIGGFFGGRRTDVLHLHSQFVDLTERVLALDELTLEEDILTWLVLSGSHRYITFDTWYHDVPTDSCYYGVVDPKHVPFYKIFL